MAEHKFFTQPQGTPWCFCKDRDCRGWTAYMAWYQAYDDTDGEPDDVTIETHREMSIVLTELTSYYSKLLGIEVDFQLALDLADIDRAAESRN
jgi:hypothetical protein